MDKHNLRQCLLLAAAALILMVVIAMIILPIKKTDTSVKVGLILTGSYTDSGWNGVHYHGVTTACDKLDAKLLLRQNVAEGTGECAEAIHSLAADGARMIILSSYGYPAEVKDIISEYPDIAFYAISAEYSAENLTSYFGRMYQARYLAGIIAGLQTETDRIGYVAAMPNSEVNRGINAFTLGVKSVNEDASVYVSWTDSWDDSEKEISAAERLINELGADVITYHQNQHSTACTADSAGVYSIGYNEVAKGLSDRYLTAAVWDWETLYYQIIREFVQGRPNETARHWFAIDSGVVGLSSISPLVSDEAVQTVESAKSRLCGTNDVFSGVIYDSDGTLRCSEGESLSDDTLLTAMDWYVDGVVMYES